MKNRIFVQKLGTFGGKLPKNMLFQDRKSDSNVAWLKISDFGPKMTSFDIGLSFNENNWGFQSKITSFDSKFPIFDPKNVFGNEFGNKF